MSIVKRYELVLENPYGNKTVIQLMINGNKTVIPIISNDNKKPEKAHLTMIDNFTMQFENGSELLSYLIANGYADLNEAKIYISYLGTSHGSFGQNTGSKEMKIEPVYSNQKELKDFLKLGETYVDSKTEEFKILFERFLKDMRNGTFRRFVDDYHFVNKRLLTVVDEYYYNINSDLYRNRIAQDFSRYKAIRGYIIGMQKYKEYLERPEKYAENNTDFPIVEIDYDYINNNQTLFDDSSDDNVYDPFCPDDRKKRIAEYESGIDKLDTNVDDIDEGIEQLSSLTSPDGKIEQLTLPTSSDGEIEQLTLPISSDDQKKPKRKAYKPYR